jgi:hypothetical protein
MGRSLDRPFRFFMNESKAIASNVYLLLYPRGEFAQQLTTKPKLAAKVFEALCDIKPEDFFAEGRVYGGGLYKMEPSELKRLPAAHIAKIAGLKCQTLFA